MSEFLYSIDDLLTLDDRPIVDFEVPEWKTKIKLRGMTALDRDAWDQAMAEGSKDGKPNLLGYRAKMVASCWVKEDGSRVVQPLEESKLNNLGAKGMERVFNKCAELNGMNEGAVEKAVQNFETDQHESSPSA